MVTNTAAEQNRLVDYYVGRYIDKFGKRPKFNRNKGTWTFKVMLYDYEEKQIIALLDYYIDHYKESAHDLDWFGYHYDDVEEAFQNYTEESENIIALRKKSEVRAAEWRARVERIKGNSSNPE